MQIAMFLISTGITTGIKISCKRRRLLYIMSKTTNASYLRRMFML